MAALNDGTSEDDVIYNKFTAYLTEGIWRCKVSYSQRRYRISVRQDHDVEVEDIASPSAESEMLNRLSLLDRLESEMLYLALKELRQRELDLLFDLVVYEMKPAEIARKLGMSYQGAMAIYYRALKKLRKRMKGDDRN